MNLFPSVAKDASYICELVSSVLGCDAEIIDKNLNRVAATGNILQTKGQKLRHGHTYTYLINNRQDLILDCPGYSHICSKCTLQGNCYYKFLIANPILLNNDVIGILAVAAFDQQKKEHLENNLGHLTKFIKQMSQLISSWFEEKQQAQSLAAEKAALQSILDLSRESTIIFDKYQGIVHYNQPALSQLGVKDIQQLSPVIRQALSGKDHCQDKIQREIFLQGKPLLLKARAINPPPTTAHPDSKLWLINCQRPDIYRKPISRSTKETETTFADIITASQPMLEVLHKAAKVGCSTSTLLILGESGTGKELLAKAIHHHSGRKGRFVPVNCGAIPDNLLESELFGYEEGAFTGACKGGKPGKFELANGGTLFLDEISTMPLHLQVKLLRVLEEQRVERLGGTNPKPIDVRIIAATNEDLNEKVKAGTFRRDLYYRIRVIPLRLPPLRERKTDIPLLAQHFISSFAERLGKKAWPLGEDARAFLLQYSWPGNVRELANMMEFAVNMCEGAEIYLKDLPLEEYDLTPQREASSQVEDLKRENLLHLLNSYGWDKEGKEKTAEALGVSLATIYRWIKKYELKPR